MNKHSGVKKHKMFSFFLSNEPRLLSSSLTLIFVTNIVVNYSLHFKCRAKWVSIKTEAVFVSWMNDVMPGL